MPIWCGYSSQEETGNGGGEPRIYLNSLELQAFCPSSSGFLPPEQFTIATGNQVQCPRNHCASCSRPAYSWSYQFIGDRVWFTETNWWHLDQLLTSDCRLNQHAFAALVASWAEPLQLALLEICTGAIQEAIAHAIATSDMQYCSPAVPVGDYDHCKVRAPWRHWDKDSYSGSCCPGKTTYSCYVSSLRCL